MENMSERVVFVLDGDAEVRASVGRALGSMNAEVVFFVRPATCLEQLACGRCDLIIADSKICELDGADLVAKSARLNPWIPVIVTIERDDVTAAVAAMKAGAVDVLEKPLDEERLRTRVESIIREDVLTDTCPDNPLTRVETRVLKMIIGGKTNSEMAHMLGRSVRTIEWHRANVMRKLGVDGLVGLIKRAAALGIIDLNAGRDTLQEPQ